MNKHIFLFIAIAAIGIVVLPQTVSMFSGQHNFYDTIGNDSSAIPCEKCHADLSVELNQPGSVNAVHRSIGCIGCHIVTPRNNGEEFHTASIPLCLDCHGGVTNSSNRIGKSAIKIFTNSDAHNKFATGANTSTLMKGSNEACIGCHTHANVKITWIVQNTMDVAVNANGEVLTITGSGTSTYTSSGN